MSSDTLLQQSQRTGSQRTGSQRTGSQRTGNYIGQSTGQSCTVRIFSVSLVILIWALCVAGCREHPRVSSPESLQLIKQVYTACNTRDPQRLQACQRDFAQLAERGFLNDAERASFAKILEMASSGQWEAAQRSSLQFARDQVR